MPSTDLQIPLGSEGSGGAGGDPGAFWLAHGEEGRTGELDGCEFVARVTR